MNFSVKPWRDLTLVAFDLETTGKYPLQAEICEIAAVKWRGGKIVDEFQSLVKPTRKMSEEVIAIHHITNDMVANSPSISEVTPKFFKFIDESVLAAHHAPFDMGFLAIEFEALQIPLPAGEVLCSAILSRRAIPESPNHRLQTLAKHLQVPAGQAHRALDDARVCLEVLIHCLQRIGEDVILEEVYKFQQTRLSWDRFSFERLQESENYLALVSAIRQAKHVEMTYLAGSRPGQAREIVPIGIVRNPEGDFLIAVEPGEIQTKRYFLNQISTVRRL